MGAIEAGQAYVKLFTKDASLVKGLGAASKRLKTFGTFANEVGTKLLSLGGAAVGGLGAATKMFADAGSDLVDMSQRTGLSVEALSELGYAAEQSGADLETLENATKKMQQKLVDVAGGSDQAKGTLKQLGVTFEQLKGKAPDEQLGVFADALANVKDPALRTSLAMDVFGKAGTKLLPLMANGSKGMDELREQAQALGLTWDTETAEGAEVFGDSLATAWSQAKKAAIEIGGALLPDVSALTAAFSAGASKVIAWIKSNRELIATAARVAAYILAGGLALLALGAAFTAAGAVIGAIVATLGAVGGAVSAIISVLGVILSPIGLVVVAIVGLAGYFAYASGAAGEAVAFMTSSFANLAADATASFGAIGKALAAGDIALAGRVLWLTLKMEWQKGIGYLNSKWQEWKAFFLNVANEAITNLAGMFVDAWAGLQNGWISLTNSLGNAWSTFTGFLTNTWHTTIGFISKAWTRLKGLFDSDLDVEAEVKRINEETAGKKGANNDATAADKAARDAAAAKAHANVERDRLGTRDALKSDHDREAKRIEDQQAAALASTADEIAAARAAWEGAVTEANGIEAPAVAAAKAKQIEIPNGDELDALAKDKTDVKGTFNAAAVSGLGTSSTAERTLKATEEVAKHTRELAKRPGGQAKFS